MEEGSCTEGGDHGKEDLPDEDYVEGRKAGLFGSVFHMSGTPIIRMDLHGLRIDEAERKIDKVLETAGQETYQLQLIHGYNRGTNLRSMIHDLYRQDPRVKRVMPGDNPGITILVLKELY